MGKYELVASDSKSANSNRLRLRSLDQQEFKIIKNAITDVLQFRSTQSLHEICRRNHHELNDFIDKITDEYVSERTLTEAAQYDALLEVNRKIMNYMI